MPPVELQCWDLWVGWGCPVTSVQVSCKSEGGLRSEREMPLCLQCISLLGECSLGDLPGAGHQAPESKLVPFLFPRLYLSPAVHSQWDMFAARLKVGDIVHLETKNLQRTLSNSSFVFIPLAIPQRLNRVFPVLAGKITFVQRRVSNNFC